MCVLYGKEKKECAYHRAPKGELNLHMLSCSLFIRYQECLDMVREAIDYIDRYRVTEYRKSKNDNLNEILLIQIKQYYGLYVEITKTAKIRTHTPELQEFLEIWEYPHNQKLNELLGEKMKCSGRITKVRPIQTYYAKSDEDIQLALEYAHKHPTDRIYDIMARGLYYDEQA